MAQSWTRLGQSIASTDPSYLEVTLSTPYPRQLRVVANFITTHTGATKNLRIQFNGDDGTSGGTGGTGSRYSRREANSGANAANGYGTDSGNLTNELGSSDTGMLRCEVSITNYTTKQKICISKGCKFLAGANRPYRRQTGFKWMNSSVQISTIRANISSGTLDDGSILTVYGTDDLNVTDFSKTAITNVPAGTRYEETDTRKIYRRVSAGTFTSTDYTTSNFTAVGSTVAITSNSAVSSSTPANTANRVYATIPSLTSTDAWSCDFQLFITADGTYDYNSIAFCTNSDAFNTSGQNQISVQTQGGGYQRFVLYARIGGSNSESTTSNSSRALNTDYYCTLSSDGANTARLRIWTNSNRTGTPAQDETLSIASIGTLTTVMHGVRNSGDSNVWSGTVSNVSLTNPAKWVEKGTA